MPPTDDQAIGKIDPVQVPADQANQGNQAEPKEKQAESGTPKAKPMGQEREFLPAALEILETPANPAGRALALALAAFFVIAVGWAIIGKIDIVAVSQGRIVPVGGVKQIQPREIGNVTAIHVSDGQHVEQDDLLIELDPTASEVDKDQLQRERVESLIEIARLTAFIRGLNGQSPDYAPPEEGLDPAIISMHRNRLDSDIAAYQAEIASMEAELSRRIADRAAIQAEVQKLKDVIPLMAEREDSLLKLLEKGITPKPVWQEAKTLLIESQHNVLIQRHRLAEAESGMEAAVKEQHRMTADRLQQAYSELAEARKSFEQSDLALRKALNREEQHQLRAPVSGVVQQLAVHTVGGVVQPAEPLMLIVPDDAELIVRAQILNRDKGFVEVGQAAEVKLESFNFTKYGTIDGEVTSVSSDAIEDENLGLVYDTRVSLSAISIIADGRDVPLTPGMSVTVEIKTGKRRVIDFLLSPLQRYQDEAIRER